MENAFISRVFIIRKAAFGKSNKSIKYPFIFQWFRNFHSVNIPDMTDSTYQCDCIEHEE